MDLTQIKAYINSQAFYSKVTQALDDIRLVWRNCQTYNIEGSEIYDWATELAAATETLIEVS